MTLEPQDVRALIDIGFIAWSRGFDTEAAKIFEAIRLERPNQEAGYIGAALVALQRGEPGRAVDHLRRIPPTDNARAFLGMALLSYGERVEAIEVLNDVVESADDSPPGRMARMVLATIGAQPLS
ncbi:MAG TPA: hypothetical protein VND97_06825 [Beijerinckiaceae bacterium]|nr:hypothetical protein [Beijerinckiaceae bacterium]